MGLQVCVLLRLCDAHQDQDTDQCQAQVHLGSGGFRPRGTGPFASGHKPVFYPDHLRHPAIILSIDVRGSRLGRQYARPNEACAGWGDWQPRFATIALPQLLDEMPLIVKLLDTLNRCRIQGKITDMHVGYQQVFGPQQINLTDRTITY